ncbi:hypothetical protein ACX0G7_02405 [Flavitalea antarctica]
MKTKSTILFSLLSMVFISFDTMAQESWPKVIKGSDGSTIRLYEFQPESFNDNLLKASAAISVTKEGSTDPVFGVAWMEALTSTRGGQVEIKSLNVSSIKLPGDVSDESLETLESDLENKSNSLNIGMPLNELQSSLALNNQQKELSGQISNKAPKVIYSTSPSILVVIDGEPKIQYNSQWGVDAVVNTPFTLVRSDGNFYLHGGKHWYVAPSVKGPFNLTTTVSPQLQKIAEQLRSQSTSGNEAAEKDENTIYKIIVSTQPAELIQSNGEAKFSSLDNSGLLFVSNSGDDIFMDVDSQNYYVLISGRWYHSKTLSGNWEYAPADRLPADFAKIPEGSPKDHVLASVAGTEAANDAVQEAAVPQTAKVDRNSAQAEVAYDGDPRFEDIDGTDIDYAVNTPASVIRWNGRYYSVDNGVWFESGRATGPWVVSVRRPNAVALIPPSYPVYHMKYVHIYDVTPEYVYMGYTPGYLNNFIYGPTVVYGTGYYYRPWFGTHYYARPYTWGFNVRYDPWIGWGLGYHYSAGWFNISIGTGRQPWGYWGGGWWGPRYYRPSYCMSPSYYGRGYYGNNAYYYNRTRSYNYGNRYYSGNIYRNRTGLVSRDYQRTAYYNRNRSARNGDWSNNVRSNRPANYNNRNNSDNRGNGNVYNNRNNNNRFNNQNNERNIRGNNLNNNNGNVGNGQPDRSDRPVRAYNPSARTDPYGRNNNINRDGNRDNNENREPNRNNGRNPNINPGARNDTGTEMPGRISRPQRAERLNNNRPENLNSRPLSASPQRQYEPRQQPQFEQRRQERQIQSRPDRQAQPQVREVQRRFENNTPSARQRENNSPARSSERSNGSSGGRRPERG